MTMPHTQFENTPQMRGEYDKYNLNTESLRLETNVH